MVIADQMVRPRIIGVGTAVPHTAYSQQQFIELLGIDDQRIRSIFLNSAISRRFLTLPAELPDGSRRTETQGQLLAKHRGQGIDLGVRALEACLKRADRELADIAHLCCVTSTGFLTPGFSSLLTEQMGISRHCRRLDVVGMGCNAALNALNAVSDWVSANPDQLAVALCVEVSSAAYVLDGTMRTAVVNSLFGDGAAAVAVTAAGHDGGHRPEILGFASKLIPNSLGAMRYDWDDRQGKFSFFLDRDVPYVVGAHTEEVIARLLRQAGLHRGEVSHWVVHSGGKKVIDSVMVNLGLTRHDLRHTTSVLRDYGNLSSGSALFSYERLVEEKVAAPGDYGVVMTMGPGSTIEAALLRW